MRFLGIFGLFNEQDGPYRQVLAVEAIDDNKVVFDKYTFEFKPKEEGDVQ